ADLAGLLDLYGRVRRGQPVSDDDTNPLVDRLRLSGVVRAAEGYLRVRNRIYARVFDHEWVRAHMPDAELRRQRAAYRRGVLRAATAAALIGMMMTSRALSAMSNAQRAQAASAKAGQYATTQQQVAAKLQMA